MAAPLALGSVSGTQLARLGQRFTWGVLAAVLFALYFLLDLHRPGTADPAALHLRLVRIPAGLTAALLWSLIVALLGEARRWSFVVRHVLTLAGFGLIALLVIAANPLDVVIGLVVGALLPMVGLAPYLGRGATQSTYWRFNHDLWIGFLASAVAAILFGAGLSAIIETLRYLFGFHISSAIHEKVWAVSTGLVGPLYWASVIPDDFETQAQEGPPTEFISRMVALLAKFILVPMLLVYAVILHVYAVKIGVDMALPKGRVGWLASIFGAMVVLAALLAYPTRESGGPLVAMFWRIWPLLLVGPVVLLFIGVSRRVGDYGWTESRYWLVVMGLWLAVLVVTQGLWRRDLRLLLGSLLVLMLVASLGPWGMYGVSSQSQAAQFATVATRMGLMENGRVKPGPPAVAAFKAGDAQRLGNIVWYFSGRQRLDLLAPFFAGDANDPFKLKVGSPSESSWQIAERIRVRLGISHSGVGRPDAISFNTQFPWAAALPDGRVLVTNHTVTYLQGQPAARRDVPAAPYKLTVTIEGARLVFESDTPEMRTVFDLAPLDAEGGPLRMVPTDHTRQPIVLQPVSGPLPLTLIATNVQGTRANGSLELRSVAYFLITGPRP